jgi:RNA recognition motif-containing protein
MSKKLYVGNLPYSIDGEKLGALFSEYGEREEATVISFKDTGKSKGFGFVTLKDDMQADKAISEMNGKEVDGRKIVVNEAKPLDENRPRRSFGGDRGGFGGPRRFGGGNRRF